MFSFFDLDSPITVSLTMSTLLGYLRHRYGCVGTDGINWEPWESGASVPRRCPPGFICGLSPFLMTTVTFTLSD